MRMNFENKIDRLGFLEYLLYSLPVNEMDQISQYIAHLNAILSYQEQNFSDQRLKKIYSIFAHLDLSDTDVSLPFIQKIRKRIQELSEIKPDDIEDIIRFNAKLHATSEIIAFDFKQRLEKEYPEPAARIPYSWFIERAEHFLIGLTYRESSSILESVFRVLPEVFSDIEFHAIFEEITKLYIQFQDRTGLPIHSLSDAPEPSRRLLLENVDNLQTFALLSNAQFNQYLQMDSVQMKAIIQHLPVLNKINMKLRYSLTVCLGWLPNQVARIEENLPLFEKILLVRRSEIDNLLSLSPEELTRIKKNLSPVLLLLKHLYTVSRILLLSDEQLNYILLHQREYVRFFNRFEKSPLISQLTNEQLILIPQFLNAANILKLTLEETLSYDEHKIKLINNNFMFFCNLETHASISAKDLLTWDEDTIYNIIKIKIVFYRLHKNGMPIEKIRRYADTHLTILEKYNDSIHKWTNFNLELIDLLLEMTTEDLESFCAQSAIIDKLRVSCKLTFKEIIAIPAEEREEIVDIFLLYQYLSKAKPGTSLNEFLNLRKDFRKDLIHYNYQYYRMLLAGFQVKELCPLYRVFFHEMLEFCEHITNMRTLKAMDEKRFYIVMFNANKFKDYISRGLVTFQQLTIFPPELLEELAKYCYHYFKILEFSGVSLEEFLKIDPIFRIKIAVHAGSNKNILRNLKSYINISPELQSEVFEFRHAYVRLLLISTVKLEQLLNLPYSIRHQILHHANVFAEIIPGLKMPFEEFVLSRQHDLIEFASFIAEHKNNILGLMQFTIDDIVKFTVEECHRLIESIDYYLSISQNFNCSIRDFYMLSPELQKRLVEHQPEIKTCIHEYQFTLNDILNLDNRADGQLCENLNIVLQSIREGSLDKEDLMEMNNIELINGINSKFFKKMSFWCPSLF